MPTPEADEVPKPCPFCGATPTVERLPDPNIAGRTLYVIGCDPCSEDCRVAVEVVADSERLVLDNWNRRAELSRSPEAPPPEKIDALLDAFQRAVENCDRMGLDRDSTFSSVAKERAILRNEIRAKLLAHPLWEYSAMTDAQKNLCKLCGEPMPDGEQMFFYHGYSGPCPKPPLRASPSPDIWAGECPDPPEADPDYEPPRPLGEAEPAADMTGNRWIDLAIFWLKEAAEEWPGSKLVDHLPEVLAEIRSLSSRRAPQDDAEAPERLAMELAIWHALYNCLVMMESPAIPLPPMWDEARRSLRRAWVAANATDWNTRVAEPDVERRMFKLWAAERPDEIAGFRGLPFDAGAVRRASGAEK